MPTVKIHFKRCLQDSQDLGGDDEHMVSQLVFDIESNEERVEDVTALIKQAIGEDFANSPIEVGRPSGYQGPFNYSEFQRVADAYYRELVGAHARVFRIGSGSRGRMRNNTLVMERSVSIEVDVDGGGW